MSPSRPEKTDIHNIHFLIHPGFLSDPTFLELGDTIAEGEALLPQYLEKVNAMRTNLETNEIILLYTHTTRAEFREAIKEGLEYAKMIRQIRRLIGRRLIVICSDHSEPEDLETSGITDIMDARQFSFDPQTVHSEAYGETLGMCVEDWAESLNEKLDLRQRTTLEYDYTDRAMTREEYLKKEAPKFKRLQWPTSEEPQ